MRIGVHLQALRPGKIGGHEQYVRQLIRLFPRIDPDVRLTLFCADYNAETFATGPNVDVQVLSPREFAALDAESLRRHRLDAWFCPLLVLEPHEPGLPAVVNIPDLQHETFPEFFSERILDWRREHYSRSAQRADGILTQSEFSRRQIIDAFGVAPGKVHAIHLDAAPEFSATVRDDDRYLSDVKRRYRLPDSFLYYPANNWLHKNHRVLFEALRSASSSFDGSLHLVLTGAQVEGAQPWADLIRQSGLGNRVRHLGYIPSTDLPGLHALSTSLVFPSLFEGFGMPIVEAMRVGCPVICSNSTVLPEVGGDAALYFDPQRPDELAARIDEVLSGRAAELVEAGRRRAQGFSWELTARSTLEVIRETARKPSPPRPQAGTPALISIITPSLQQARFIERTLESVLGQGYPRLEYWVIDGGSTDGTLEILERYRRQYPDVFDYVSEPDSGQAGAVNKGLQRVRGDIIGWLNSDDTYEPGSLAAVARAFEEHPACDIVYGQAHFITDSETDEPMGTYPTRPRFNWYTLAHECYLCQPTVFWRRAVTDHGYRLDEDLRLCLDYDFWIRLGRRFRFQFIAEHIANSRIYPQNKTLSQQENVYEEVLRVVKRHYGWVPWSWAIGRAHYRRAGGDSFFNIKPVAASTYLWAFFCLVRCNWSAPRHWPRLAREIRPAFVRWAARLWRRLLPAARRTLKVPAPYLVVELGVEVTRPAHGSSAVDLWCDEHRLDRLPVNGPGRYTKRISLPQKEGTRPYRLTVSSDLLRDDTARVLEPQAFEVAAEDGWLEQQDTLLLPADWKEVEIAFMLPVGADDGIRMTFDYHGRRVDEWVFDRPGVYRRQLRLPPGVASNGCDTELEFASNAALPPQPRRGEQRRLAMRIQEVVDLTAADDEATC